MTSNENLVQQYKKMFKKMLELKNLLADILISFHVIEEDNDESFHQMLSYVKQIETVYPYLYTVGLNPNIINEDITLRHYIECLYQIERVKTTYIIIHNDATLYRNVQNSVPITIFDDTNEQNPKTSRNRTINL